jgi:peptidoglycan/LPS O-acetylase OafA/YrhL
VVGSKFLKHAGEPSNAGTNPGPSLFRPEIEGLRAIAIFLVVGYHALVPGFSGGYIGVDVFFVLSGYLITGLLIREIEQSGTVDICGFYARRARRLLPALALTLLATIVVSAAIYAPVQQVGFGTTAMSTAMYASNLYFAKSGTDYFAEDREKNPLLHTWSLSVEEQFYLAWPLFIMFAMKVFRRQNRAKNSHRRVLWWMTAVAGLSYGLSFYLTGVRQPWAYFMSPARAWEFALGAIVVLLPQAQLPLWARSNKRIDPRFTECLQILIGRAVCLLGWTGIGGILVSSFSFGKTTLFPGFAVLLPAFSTAFVLYAAANDTGKSIVNVLGVRPFQKIGQLSYSWYLWHWPVIIIGSEIVASPTWPVRAFLVAFSLGLSIVSYRLVENPIRHNYRLSHKHAYSLAMAGFLAVIGIGVSLIWRQTSIWAAQSPAQLRFSRAHGDGPSMPKAKGCIADYFDTNVKSCTFDSENSPVTLVLLGDSHAMQWFPAVESISKRNGWRLVLMVKSACAMVDAPYFYGPMGRRYEECSEWRRSALEKIRQIRPALTLMTFSEGYDFSDAQCRTGTASVIKSLAESSQKVLVLRDNPRPGFDLPNCLAVRQWRSSFIPSISCQFALPPASKIYEFQKLAARNYRNVRTVDISSTICPGGICSGELDNIIVYRDTNHLTSSFVKSVEGVISEQIKKALAGGSAESHISALFLGRSFH